MGPDRRDARANADERRHSVSGITRSVRNVQGYKDSEWTR